MPGMGDAMACETINRRRSLSDFRKSQPKIRGMKRSAAAAIHVLGPDGVIVLPARIAQSMSGGTGSDRRVRVPATKRPGSVWK